MKIWFSLLFSVALFLFTGCSDDDKVTIPPDVLSKEQMVKVMTKIYILDGATDQQNFSTGVIMPADPMVTYERFFQADSIKYADFQKSYDFYLDHPTELSDIYNEVLNELSRLQAVHSK